MNIPTPDEDFFPIDFCGDCEFVKPGPPEDDFYPVDKLGRKRGGRTKGAKNFPVVEAVAIRCPNCGSSERAGYKRSKPITAKGFHDGCPYNRIVSKTCRCKSCGELRVEKYFELVNGAQ